MNTFAIFAAAIAVTYLLRVAFVVIVPPERLPAPVVQGLAYVGPSAAAALATAAVLHGVRTGSGPAIHLTALLVAIVVARWKGGTGVTVVAAVAAAWVVQLLR